MAELVADRVGDTINGYTITRRIGGGGMGSVWAAEKQVKNIRVSVAIKLLLSEWSGEPEFVDRFLKEAEAVRQIQHAGIVKIQDLGFHNDEAFLIMELLDGETLGARLRRERLSIGHVCEFGKQIADVLEATHAADIIHRDLKPENIFLVRERGLRTGERVKILDFGIAKIGSATGRTRAGSMGTPGYMAPEQHINAANADARADVYAFGCIVFEMCCGRRVCEVSTADGAPRVRDFAPDVPQELDDLIASSLAMEPSSRPTTRRLYEVLSRLAATTGPKPPALSRPEWRARRPGSAIGAGTLAMVFAGTFVLVALVVFGLAKMRAAEPAGLPDRVDVAMPENAWVRIAVPPTPVVLGIRSEDAPDDVRGFRPARRIASPLAPYELQEHEVTWSEIEPWLAASHIELALPSWATDPRARASLPVTGAPWKIAREYCQSLGGDLPTEEQWEYAARGPGLRANSWGEDRLDRSLTHVYAGPSATPDLVKHSGQDRTPDLAIYDLIGNVQEWTRGLWREDKAGIDESWVARGESEFRTIRGLPLAADPPELIPDEGAAHREPLCAKGPCVSKSRTLRTVGFRCQRPAR